MNLQLQKGCFHGARISLQEIEGLTLSEYRYSPFCRVPVHSHATAYLSIPLRGSYIERSGSREVLCEEGTSLFHPQEENHSDLFELRGGRVLSIELARHWVYRLREEYIATAESIFSRAHVCKLGTKLALHLRQRQVNDLYAEGLALEILAQLPSRRRVRDERAEPPWLKIIEEFLHEHFDAKISLRQLCDDIGIHPAHVNRTFKRFRSVTMSESIRRLRIEKAQSHLLGKSRSVAEIAALLGFSDQSHFSRTFKRETGLSPRHFRKKMT